MACGCSPSNGSSPPGGFTPTSGTSPGATTSYGGSSPIAGTPCGPPACPTPPTSSQVGRAAYCPSWVENLFGSYSGKLIIKVGGCLNFLLSKVSGYVWYDATTESVKVTNSPPFASNVPRGTKFGYVAKTIPVATMAYDEATNACTTSIAQEVGSQVMESRADGQIVLGNQPLPGEVPINEAADSLNQVRFDYLDPENSEDQTTVSDDVGFFTDVPLIKSISGQQFISKLWLRARKLRMRLSQWGQLKATDAAFGTARTLVAVPIPGGTSTDPAFELRMTDAPPASAAQTLPVATSGQTPLFLAGTIPGGYYADLPRDAYLAVPRGLGYFPCATPVHIVTNRTTAGTATGLALPTPISRPNETVITAPAGPVTVKLKVQAFAQASTQATISHGSDLLAYGYDDSMDLNQVDVLVGAWTGLIDLVFAKPVGSGTIQFNVWVIGYYF